MEAVSKIEKHSNAEPGYCPATFSPRRPAPRARLFCFPFAGGGASIYRTWTNNMPAGIQLIPIQLPGRETRLQEQPFTDLGPLIAEIASAIQGCCDQPFAFFGHSMGALIGFELARWFQRQGISGPRHLFVSGHRAPQVGNIKAPIHNLPEEQFIESVVQLNGTPREVLQNRELLRLVLPALRADFAMVETYRYLPSPPLDCPITALGGLNDGDAGREDLKAWKEQTSSEFRIVMFEGDHFFIRTAESQVLRALCYDLQRLL